MFYGPCNHHIYLVVCWSMNQYEREDADSRNSLLITYGHHQAISKRMVPFLSEFDIVFVVMGQTVWAYHDGLVFKLIAFDDPKGIEMVIHRC